MVQAPDALRRADNLFSVMWRWRSRHAVASWSTAVPLYFCCCAVWLVLLVVLVREPLSLRPSVLLAVLCRQAGKTTHVLIEGCSPHDVSQLFAWSDAGGDT